MSTEQHADTADISYLTPGKGLWVVDPGEHVGSHGCGAYNRLAAESVTVPAAATEQMGQAARAAQTWLAVEVNEHDRGSGTPYNTLLYFAP